MGLQGGPGLGRGQVAEAPEVMVPVALNMRDPQRRYGREVLLQGDDGKVGKILGALEVEVLAGFAVELADEPAVEQALEDALAVFMRGAAVAQFGSAAEAVEAVIGFIENNGTDRGELTQFLLDIT